MTYNPTNWKDRIIEKPNTFNVQENSDGTVTLIPVTGQVLQQGTPLNAQNLNKIEQGLVETNSQLAQTATKIELSNAVAPKADKVYVDDELSQKRNKNDPIGLDDAREDLLSAITGNTELDILSIPRPYSVTREKYDKAFVSANMFDKDSITKNVYVNHQTGQLVESETRNTSEFIEIEPNTNYTIKKLRNYAFYDGNKNYVSGNDLSTNDFDNHTFTSPGNVRFMRFSYYNSGQHQIADDEQMMVRGSSLPSEYIPYYFKLRKLLIDKNNIQNNSIDSSMRTNLGEDAKILPSIRPVNFDFENNELTIPANSYILFRNKAILLPETTINLNIGGASRGFIYFDTENETFSTYRSNTISSISENDVFVGSYRLGTNTVLIDCDNYTINNENPYKQDNYSKIEGLAAWEDFIIVGNRILGFERSDLTGGETYENDIGNLYVYGLDGTLYRTLRHNFGHCNTVDYNPITDTLILGSGSGYRNLDEWVYIIKNVKHWLNLESGTLLDLENNNIQGSQITKIFVGRDFGDKVNVVWGEDNFNQYNICHVISNDGQDFRKLLLGQGNNQLENGQFISGRSSDEFNGTYKILSHWTIDKSDVIQGGCFNPSNGCIYLGMGHDGLWIDKIRINDDGVEIVDRLHQKYYQPNGEPTEYDAMAGVFIKDDVLYARVRSGGVSAINRFNVF